jgi:hypothetical protein
VDQEIVSASDLQAKKNEQRKQWTINKTLRAIQGPGEAIQEPDYASLIILTRCVGQVSYEAATEC